MKALEITVRNARPDDLDAAAQIVYSAFKSIADLRNFEPDFPSVDVARVMGTIFLNHPRFYGVAAEADGKLIGLNFLTERSEIRGVGPIVVDPSFHGKGVGRILMKAVIERGKDAAGIRLVQDAANTVSISLYASLGFAVKEPLFLMFGNPKSEPPPNWTVRLMTRDDLEACNDLCRKSHGISRGGELEDAMAHFGSLVAVRGSRIVAYATAPTLWVMNHGVAESEEDLKALLLHAAALKKAPLSLLVPARNHDLFQWCLSEGLRVVKPMTLMAMGAYQNPQTPFYPSVEY
jgi:GNAT superfamily N-acetyltransferase